MILFFSISATPAKSVSFCLHHSHFQECRGYVCVPEADAWAMRGRNPGDCLGCCLKDSAGQTTDTTEGLWAEEEATQQVLPSKASAGVWPQAGRRVGVGRVAPEAQVPGVFGSPRRGTRPQLCSVDKGIMICCAVYAAGACGYHIQLKPLSPQRAVVGSECWPGNGDRMPTRWTRASPSTAGTSMCAAKSICVELESLLWKACLRFLSTCLRSLISDVYAFLFFLICVSVLKLCNVNMKQHLYTTTSQLKSPFLLEFISGIVFVCMYLLFWG